MQAYPFRQLSEKQLLHSVLNIDPLGPFEAKLLLRDPPDPQATRALYEKILNWLLDKSLCPASVPEGIPLSSVQEVKFFSVLYVQSY